MKPEFEALTRNLPDGFLMLSSSGRIEAANTAASGLLGVPSAALQTRGVRLQQGDGSWII